MPEVGQLPLDNGDSQLRALRPLLTVPREAIAAYAIAHRLHWDEDESNADESLARNWMRRSVGPLLAARYPRWRESLARAAAHFGEAAELLSTTAPERLSAATLRAAPKAKAKLMLREFLRAAGTRAPDAKRLDEMLRQVLESPSDAKLELAHDGKVLRRFRNELALVPTTVPQGEVVFHACRGAGIDAARFKAGAISVRVRQGGERMRVAANRPSRTLKNLFQEAGIPPWERDRLPLLCCGEDLVWVPGLGIAAGYRAAKGCAGLLPEWKPGPRD
jgi:tRNA(Ile)-lysidine synthase